MYVHLEEPRRSLATVRSLGMDLCEVYAEDVGPEAAEALAREDEVTWDEMIGSNQSYQGEIDLDRL